MSILSRLFGTKSAETPNPEPKPIPESVLEWRRLSELPPPVLKRLRVDAETLNSCGPPSSLHPPIQPARVIDEVPEGYRGELYYRIVPSQRGSARNPRAHVSLLHKGLKLEDQPGQRLALAMRSHVAQGREQHLFAEPGVLRPEFQRALPARLRASASKPFAEYHGDIYPMVSARFRRVVEALEPGVHLFIPLDTSEGRQEPELYVFYPGVTFRPTGLAIEANAIAGSMLPDGGLQFSSPNYLSARHFYLLNRNVIGSAEIFTDGWFGPIFSQRAVERLGDVLQRELAFMPMGVCEEPLPPDARRCTRDGGEEQLGAVN
jgi:hypothetical protein